MKNRSDKMKLQLPGRKNPMRDIRYDDSMGLITGKELKTLFKSRITVCA